MSGATIINTTSEETPLFNLGANLDLNLNAENLYKKIIIYKMSKKIKILMTKINERHYKVHISLADWYRKMHLRILHLGLKQLYGPNQETVAFVKESGRVIKKQQPFNSGAILWIDKFYGNIGKFM
jgi:hypothetical protein